MPQATTIAPAVHRLELPLGIHGVSSVSAWLLRGDDGDSLVDCGIANDATRELSRCLQPMLDRHLRNPQIMRLHGLLRDSA